MYVISHYYNYYYTITIQEEEVVDYKKKIIMYSTVQLVSCGSLNIKMIYSNY